MAGKTHVETFGADTYEWALGNYAGLLTGEQIDESYSTDKRKKAFFNPNSGTRVGDITDGTSNTICISEMLTGSPGCYRGNLWGDEPINGFVNAKYPPNSPQMDVTNSEPGACVNMPEVNLPCVTGISRQNVSGAARSFHPGGVNSLFADGSVQFIGDSIDSHNSSDPLFPGTWQRLAGICDDQIVGPY